MTAPTEAAALAAEICERFGETGERQRRQVERMVGLMGAAWVRSIVKIVAFGAHTSARKVDGSPRTMGGVFFAVACRAAYVDMKAGKIARRPFYATFCWREPKPRKARPAPLPRARGGPSWSVGRVPRMPEVAVRRRAVAS